LGPIARQGCVGKEEDVAVTGDRVLVGQQRDRSVLRGSGGL
jgi:hypothetical protein